MEVLYNDGEYLRYEVNWLLCSDEIIDVNSLEHLARCQGYGGGDDISLFTYAEENNDIFPIPEGKVALIIWDDAIYHDEIDTVVLYDADVFYQYLKQESLRAALIHPFQLKRIITSLAKIKHDLKLDQ